MRHGHLVDQADQMPQAHSGTKAGTLRGRSQPAPVRWRGSERLPRTRPQTMKGRTMTQYFLSLPHDSAEEPTMATMDPAELQEVFAAVDAFNSALQKQGAWVFAGGLNPPSTATTVD